MEGGAMLMSTEVRRKALMVQRKWVEVGNLEVAEDHREEEVHREEVREEVIKGGVKGGGATWPL